MAEMYSSIKTLIWLTMFDKNSYANTWNLLQMIYSNDALQEYFKEECLPALHHFALIQSTYSTRKYVLQLTL